MVRVPLLTLLVSCFTLVTSIALADTLVLPNGERISGTVIKEEGGVVEFKTTYLGTVKAKTAEVKVIRDIAPVVGDIPMPISAPAETKEETETTDSQPAGKEPKAVPI